MVSNLYISQLPSIKELIAKHNITADKNLGQNFLTDFSITDLIVSYVPNIEEATVFEVGPGLGTLTRSILAKSPKKLHVVEFDERFVSIIEEIKVLAGESLEIHHADALNFKFDGDDLTIVSNLPYNIGTSLVLSWIKSPHVFKDMFVMLQKEVVDRICAQPSAHNYSRLAILCALNYDAEILFDIGPESFTPAPKVTSSVVALRRKEQVISEKVFKSVELITERLFQNRRKKIRSSLSKLIPAHVLDTLNIDMDKRPQDLSVREIIGLAEALESSR